MKAVIVFMLTALAIAAQPSVQLLPEERAMLERIDVSRTLQSIQHLSENIVTNNSGAGAGSAIAGSADERKLADYIERELRAIGLQTRQEPFPVRHYEYAPVLLTANDKRLEAISLHAAGGTWGTRDGVPYARGNDGPERRRVRARLVDVGEGYAPDYAKAGDVKGQVVLVRRTTGWPTYQIIEAAQRGAVALLMFDYPGGREDTLKQDSMWYHEQLPVASIRKANAHSLQQALTQGPVEVTLENRIDIADGVSTNVIATIRGTDFPDEWLTVSAHHDRWFKAAVDDCAGIASMLELARLFTSAAYTPRRSIMFISFGAEEAGIEATESDWLAGSEAFVRDHPEVTRRLALGVNIDVTGWGGQKGDYMTTSDNAGFAERVVADLGLTSGISVHPVPGSTTDAWNLSAIGGGTVAMIRRTEAAGGVFAGGSSYAAIYHTDLDVFRPEHFPNLAEDLRLEALSLLRMDRATMLPIDFGRTASWIESALQADLARTPAVDYADVKAALDRFRLAWRRIEGARQSAWSAQQARAFNLWMLKTRKELLPWVLGRSGGVRTSNIANQLQALTTAREAAERGDAEAALKSLDRVAGAARRVSRTAFVEQRLYAYTSGDWSAQFGHRPRPLPMAMYDIYHRLIAGADVKTDAASLARLETEVRGHLVDALFLIAGKLRQAAQSLDETPLP